MSEAVAPPNVVFIVAVVGLQPRAVDAEEDTEITGEVISKVQVTVCDAVPILPQASVAVQVLVCEREQPVLPTGPSLAVGVSTPLQLSEAVALPNAPLIVAVVGLQPRAVVAVDVGVITGAVTSSVHVTVLDVEAELPQASVAVHVLVCERAQPVLPIEPSDEVGVIAPQLSVAVALPNVELIIAVDGLQPNAVDAVDVAVIVGPDKSNVHVTVREAVPVFPHASVADHVLVCDLEQPVDPTAPSETVGVNAPEQLSEAVAPPNPASIVAVDGLQPRAVDAVDDVVIIGAVTSNVHVTVLEFVPVFPQASVAVQVLVCDLEQPVLPTMPSDAVGVREPLQLSEAVAFPNVALIVAVVGLHPSAVAAVDDAVTIGAVTSNVQVTVLEFVPIFPQASVAVHVLVCDLEQPVDPSGPSEAVGMIAPLQLSDAVALPNAVLIVAEVGLQPSAVDEVVVGVITGAVTSNVQVTVKEEVPVFPQASVAVQVLV